MRDQATTQGYPALQASGPVTARGRGGPALAAAGGVLVFALTAVVAAAILVTVTVDVARGHGQTQLGAGGRSVVVSVQVLVFIAAGWLAAGTCARLWRAGQPVSTRAVFLAGLAGPAGYLLLNAFVSRGATLVVALANVAAAAAGCWVRARRSATRPAATGGGHAVN